jgi:hypothetical protein
MDIMLLHFSCQKSEEGFLFTEMLLQTTANIYKEHTIHLIHISWPRVYFNLLITFNRGSVWLDSEAMSLLTDMHNCTLNNGFLLGIVLMPSY